MIYWELIWSFFQVGLLGFGGGYAAMPLIQHQVVELHPWMTMTEFSDLLTISQMTPGPIAINAATFVGTRVAGIPGALAATIGCVLPSCVVVLALAVLYARYRRLALIQGVLSGLRPAVVALIAASGLSIVYLTFFGTEVLPALASSAVPDRYPGGAAVCRRTVSAAEIPPQSHLGDAGHGGGRIDPVPRGGMDKRPRCREDIIAYFSTPCGKRGGNPVR